MPLYAPGAAPLSVTWQPLAAPAPRPERWCFRRVGFDACGGNFRSTMCYERVFVPCKLCGVRFVPEGVERCEACEPPLLKAVKAACADGAAAGDDSESLRAPSRTRARSGAGAFHG